MQTNHKKLKMKVQPWLIVAFVLLLLYSLTMLAPIYFVIVNSLKRPSQFLENPWTISNVIYLANYKNVLTLKTGGTSLPRMYLNTMILTTAATLISTISTTVTAYVLARFDFRGKKLLVAVGIGAMLIPDLGSRAVIYKMYVDLHMIDTWWILIQYAQPFGLMFLITYSLYVSVSKTYVEAAKIDGASEMRIFLQIMVPMGKGVIGMTIVMQAISVWNDFYTPYMYLPSVKTLSLGIQELAEEVASTGNYTVLYAAMVLTMLPILILFICMRKTIINNAVAGGIKG